jgi:lysozyme
MKTSPNGLRFLESNEGRVLHVYPDSCRIPTVGVGHVVTPADGLHMGDPITEAQCQAFLAHDVEKCEAEINSFGLALTQNQFDALVSLSFNIGVAGLASSTVVADLKVGNIADERRAFEMWDKDTKNGKLVVDNDLLARRDREVALFLTPDTAPQSTAVAPMLPDNDQPTPPDDLPPAA